MKSTKVQTLGAYYFAHAYMAAYMYVRVTESMGKLHDALLVDSVDAKS